MTSWRTLILKEFTPQLSRLTLVADPDGLMTEAGVLQGIRERGFELIPFEDPVAFRYAYESKYRSLWDQGHSTELVVALRSEVADLRLLPFDLLQTGRQLRFNIGEIFPRLTYPVVEALDRADFEALHAAQAHFPPDMLGENGTKDFILRHVFAFAPEVVTTPAALLRCLLAKHYRSQQIPRIFEERMVALLRQNRDFLEWPLEQIARDRHAFFGFVQERWPRFLHTMMAHAKRAALKEEPPATAKRFPGPDDLPFDHPEVKVYIDNLFVEGLLNPVEHLHAHALASEWVSVGLKLDPQRDAIRRFQSLATLVERSIPQAQSRHQEWLNFAFRWAELEVAWQQVPVQRQTAFVELQTNLGAQVNDRYQQWLVNRFETLHNQPPVPPVMVHHIPRFLAREMERERCRVALVVLDGLALAQWMTLQECLTILQPKFAFQPQAVFAWVPTLTPISRQSMFAGKPPLLFPQTLLTTEKDAAHWAVFWLNQGLAEQEVFHAMFTGNEDPSQIAATMPSQTAKALGIVVTKPDMIMHGMQLGAAGMHNQIRQWAERQFAAALFTTLLQAGYRLFVSSDHGNIEARGCGNPAEGMLAETRGQRARIYNHASIRDSIRHDYPQAIVWDPVGLPDACFPLLAPHRQAFVPKSATILCHGGNSLEEMIVPLIELTFRK